MTERSKSVSGSRTLSVIIAMHYIGTASFRLSSIHYTQNKNGHSFLISINVLYILDFFVVFAFIQKNRWNDALIQKWNV